MIRSKYFGLAAVAFAMLSLGACTTDSDSAAPTISSALYVSGYAANDTTTTLLASTNYHLAGTVKDVASWSWTIVRASDNAVVDTIITNAPAGSGSTDIGSGSATLVQFTPTAKWGPTGIYYVQGVLTGTDGNKLTAQVKIKAAPGGSVGTALTIVGTFTAGGFDASAGSFISLSSATAYHTKELTTDRTNIDLVVTADASGYAIFESTALGVTNNDLTDSYWAPGKATEIVKVTSTPTTVEQAKAFGLTSSNQSAFIADGGVYVALTTSGVYYVIKASSVSGAGDAVSLTVTLLK